MAAPVFGLCGKRKRRVAEVGFVREKKRADGSSYVSGSGFVGTGSHDPHERWAGL